MHETRDSTAKFDEYKEPISDEVIKNFTEFVKITDKDEQKMFVDKLPDNLKIPFDVYVKRQVKVLMYEKSIEKGEDISYVLEQLDDAERKDVEKYISDMKFWMENYSKEYYDFLKSQDDTKKTLADKLFYLFFQIENFTITIFD